MGQGLQRTGLEHRHHDLLDVVDHPGRPLELELLERGRQLLDLRAELPVSALPLAGAAAQGLEQRGVILLVPHGQGVHAAQGTPEGHERRFGGCGVVAEQGVRQAVAVAQVLDHERAGFEAATVERG